MFPVMFEMCRVFISKMIELLCCNNNNNNNIISAFLQRLFLGIQSAVAYIITPSGNRHNHFASLRMICNWPSARPICTQIVISPIRQVTDALWSTRQIEIKNLAQGLQHAGRSGARTHNIDGLVIMSPALFPLHCVCCQLSTIEIDNRKSFFVIFS